MRDQILEGRTHPKVIWPDLTYPSVACLVGLGAMTGVLVLNSSNWRDVLWNERNLARYLEARAAVGFVTVIVLW